MNPNLLEGFTAGSRGQVYFKGDVVLGAPGVPDGMYPIGGLSTEGKAWLWYNLGLRLL